MPWNSITEQVHGCYGAPETLDFSSLTQFRCPLTLPSNGHEMIHDHYPNAHELRSPVSSEAVELWTKTKKETRSRGGVSSPAYDSLVLSLTSFFDSLPSKTSFNKAAKQLTLSDTHIHINKSISKAIKAKQCFNNSKKLFSKSLDQTRRK